MPNIKLRLNTWDSSNVYDATEGKTQKQINAEVAETVEEVSGLKTAITEVWEGSDRITVLTQEQFLAKYPLYSTNTSYSAADSTIGKLFPDQISTSEQTDAYAVLFDISEYNSITYPKFKNSSGHGCLVLDANYIVTKNMPNINDATGTMATVTFDANDKYFLFGATRTLVAMEWSITLYADPVNGVNELNENVSELNDSVDSLDTRVTELENADNKLNVNFDAEIVGFICYGQSWSMGYDTNAIVSTQRYDNLMLDSGLMNDPASDLTISANAFSPLAEATVWSNSNHTQQCGETPCTGQTDIVKQLLLSENGLSDTDIKYQIFSAAPGYGDATLEELAYGTDYYDRLIDVVTTANTIARSQGKVFVVPAISWAQGKAANNDNTYYDQLEELRVHLDTDIKAITGQTIPVKMIVWQAVFGNTTPKRFYDRFVYASEKYENIICSGTFYNFDHVATNNLHLTANSQDLLGCQFGIAYKRSIIDGNKFIPLKPKKAEVFGNIVYIDFDVPVKPLVFDTTLVASNTNYGFQIIDSSEVEKTISAVEIIAPDKIKIVCASDIATTDHIVYGGSGGSDYSPTTGKRGNLRDSQSIVYKNHNNVDLPCYNWCVVFDKTIAELTPST